MREGRRAPGPYESACRGARVDSSELRFEDLGDFARLRKATGLFLREEDLVVEGDVERPAGPFDQPGFEAELVPDFLRQTGGSRVIASGSTVFDDKSMIHPNSPFIRIIQRRVQLEPATCAATNEPDAEKILPSRPTARQAGIAHRFDGNTETFVVVSYRVRTDSQSETNFQKKVRLPPRFLVQSLYNIVSTIGERR